MADPTKFYQLIPAARVHLGDLTTSPTYSDDIILTVLRVTTGFLELMGYDKSYETDWNGFTSVTLSAKEQNLYGKAVAVLIRNPKALQTAATAVSVRTEEVSYSTETAGRLVQDIAATDIAELRSMIQTISGADGILVARRPDYGVQWGLDSDTYGTDPTSD